MRGENSKAAYSRKVTVRFTPEEYSKLHTGFKSTTCRKLSDYVRAALLHKPLTVYTRNRSYDDFLAEMIRLRAELKALGNNFNQAVKKLHTLDNFTEIKAWAIINEADKQNFLKKVAEINEKIAQISDRWSQE